MLLIHLEADLRAAIRDRDAVLVKALRHRIYILNPTKR